MKLAVVVDTFPRWSERFIARELSELARRGVDFSIFCLIVGSLPDDDDPDFSGLAERRVVLPSCVMPRRLATRGSTDLERCRKLAQKELGIRGYAKVQCASVLSQLLRDGKFTHVYAHFANLPSTIGWLAVCEAELPFLFSAHARDVFVEPQLLKEKISDCEALFCCHARALEFLRSQADASDRKKIALMHHGLPLNQFSFRERRISEVPAILAAGRFVPKKGFATLIDALADERLRERDIRAVLLGEGPLEKKLQAQIKKLKLGKKIQIVPPASGLSLRKQFDSADLFIAPYESAEDGDADGVPNTILEAFALGIPVIGSDAGSLSEVLTDKTGAVVPQKNPEALAKALLAFLDDPKAAVSRSRAARSRIEHDYDIQKNIAPLMSSLGISV